MDTGVREEFFSENEYRMAWLRMSIVFSRRVLAVFFGFMDLRWVLSCGLCSEVVPRPSGLGSSFTSGQDFCCLRFERRHSRVLVAVPFRYFQSEYLF